MISEVPLFSDELRMTSQEKEILARAYEYHEDLYHIYYSEHLDLQDAHQHDLRAKLQQQVINPNFVQIFNSIGYNPTFTEMVHFQEMIPPQQRPFDDFARCHSYVQKLPNKKEFNIVDLSLLIHILNKIEDHEINNLTDLKIQDVLIFKRNVVLDNFYGNGNWHGDPEIKNFTLKVDAAIEYFENKILKPYLNAIDIHFKYATDEENENFIRARLAGQRNFMPKDHFDFFLYTYGFKSDEQGNISRIELNQEEDVYQSQLLQNPTQGEKNLFIFYQLFTLARTLIKLFVNHKNFNGVDDRSYAKFYLEDFGRPNIK
uniref:Protein kinase domain-containing protein n=1 Tax=Meloidogyne hapla TaxID=6305 RepID=A0A1I8BV28_MELHA